MANNFAKDYVDVAERIGVFRDKYPTGSLQPADPMEPVKVRVLGDKTFLEYTAVAYRTPDDERPGIGVAWEPFPGRTPYTKDSEAMVAETSAWGRAIVAVLAADTKRGVASADEVRVAQDRRNVPQAAPVAVPDEFLTRLDASVSLEELQALWHEAGAAGWITPEVTALKDKAKARLS